MENIKIIGFAFLLCLNPVINCMEDHSHLPTIQLDQCQIVTIEGVVSCKVIIRNKKNWKSIKFPEYLPYEQLKEVDESGLITLTLDDYRVTFKCLESEFAKIKFQEILKDAYEHYLLHPLPYTPVLNRKNKR